MLCDVLAKIFMFYVMFEQLTGDSRSSFRKFQLIHSFTQLHHSWLKLIERWALGDVSTSALMEEKGGLKTNTYSKIH